MKATKTTHLAQVSETSSTTTKQNGGPPESKINAWKLKSRRAQESTKSRDTGTRALNNVSTYLRPLPLPWEQGPTHDGLLLNDWDKKRRKRTTET